MLYIEIENEQTLKTFVTEAKEKTGLFKELRIEPILNSGKLVFPIRIPIDVDQLLALASNPVIKKVFGKKMETATYDYLRMALSRG